MRTEKLDKHWSGNHHCNTCGFYTAQIINHQNHDLEFIENRKDNRKEEEKETFMESSKIAFVLQMLATKCNENAEKHGFWEDETNLLEVVKTNSLLSQNGKEGLKKRVISLFNSEKIALEMSELAERLETLRKDPEKKDEHCPEFLSIEVEVADLIIRALDFSGRRSLRIGEALVAKMKFNESRQYKHGKAF